MGRHNTNVSNLARGISIFVDRLGRRMRTHHLNLRMEYIEGEVQPVCSEQGCITIRIVDGCTSCCVYLYSPVPSKTLSFLLSCSSKSVEATRSSA